MKVKASGYRDECWVLRCGYFGPTWGTLLPHPAGGWVMVFACPSHRDRVAAGEVLELQQ